MSHASHGLWKHCCICNIRIAYLTAWLSVCSHSLSVIFLWWAVTALPRRNKISFYLLTVMMGSFIWTCKNKSKDKTHLLFHGQLSALRNWWKIVSVYFGKSYFTCVLAEYLGSIKRDLWYFQEHLLYSAGAERNGFMQLFSAWQVIALRFPEVLGLQGKGLCAPKY